ncbi:MAG: ribosome assembly RNA-binding protein YhbY [Ruminococcaceae bacterium]|nr:ribosome assembly RNA-binding protein YhbY [Oscillospiraceae bacterium]
MLTSKQRAYLRGLANTENAIMQVGKGGINENFVKNVNDALEKREIIKIHVLENSLMDTREVCGEVCSLTGAEPVQVIGSKFVIYKESKENKTIVLPKANKAVKK